ncbi:MAG TPA: VWA domain-containing protein [Terracidiphilus sp.]|jgi:VWFA-related protein
MRRPASILPATLLSTAIFLAVGASSLSQSPASPPSAATSATAPASPAKEPVPDLKVSSRLVVVDVVVRKGSHPVSGLDQSDFMLSEDGKPQSIRYFTPHFAGDQPADANAATPPPSLPPDTFSNLPLPNVTDSVTVLLLDGLNTAPSDVQYARREMIAYLKKLPAGRRIAVFALGQRLRMLQGFTTDSTQLQAALEKTKASSPASLLAPDDQTFQDRAVLDSMADGGVSTQDIANTQNFMSDAGAQQTAMRIGMTLEALQQLSRYLAAINGRKNLVWFAGSVPLQFFADYAIVFNGAGGGQASDQILPIQGFEQELKDTADMLVAARVAVYPVDARGVQAPSMFSSANQTDYARPGATGGPRGGRFGTDQQISQNQLAADHGTFDSIAQETGGRAVHDSNGLQEAMGEAVDDGSNYYTLAYVPSDTNFNGAERNIQVRLTHGKADLFYRRSYYADAALLSEDAVTRNSRAIFLDSMQRGVPSASQVLFKVHAAATDQKPVAGSIAGANAALKNPAARYSIDYAVDPQTLGLTQDSSGAWQDHVAVLAMAYDSEGNRLNWVVDNVALHLDPPTKARADSNGLGFHQTLDVPAGDIYLRLGIYDGVTGRFGTLEVPLHISGGK